MRFVPTPGWGSIHGQPQVPLGVWPTPIHRLDRTSDALGLDVWVKREDLAGAWGGNKVRKLEFWLARAEVWKTRSVIVSGAGGSTWTAAAAFHARSLGLRSVIALAGEVPDERRKLYSDIGARVVHHANLNALPFVIAKARLMTRRSTLLPMGGSGWPGDLGSYFCGVEIVEAYLRRSSPRPGRIFVAAGTSGTAAGIAVALAHRADGAPVVAVRVAPRPFATERAVRRRAKKLSRKMHPSPGAQPVAIVGENRFFGEGYGKPAEGLDEAIELAAGDGLELERTYTAKAFAALVSHARAGANGPLLFIHTAAGPAPDVFAHERGISRGR